MPPRTFPISGPHFVDLGFNHGLLHELSNISIYGWNKKRLQLPGECTHFGLASSQAATLISAKGAFPLNSGMYFSSPGPLEISGEGRGLVISIRSFKGIFSLGGPIEDTGRLRYIDGCTDTLLIAPLVLGDPCLNLLHIPPRTHQTAHTHPSLRVGLIVSGRGTCITPSSRIPLIPGTRFLIPAEAEHSFHTETEGLLVVAWHPDSDFGPTHQNHPMVNRTIVGGVSAAQLPEIQTQEVNRAVS